ncbi:DNA endonuclease SmrA [Paraglaciecola aestuariivivens]
MLNQDGLDDELLAFRNELKDVTPIAPSDKVFTQAKADSLAKQLKRQAIESSLQKAENYLTNLGVKPIDPYDHISYKQDGVQDGVFKNLRMAKYKIDYVLNLQQLKLESAQQGLFSQIISSHKLGHRMLLIKHGLGLHSQPFKGLLKSYVNHWLRQIPEVIAFYTAQSRHGGNSAVYVLIKKNQTDKANNRELHGKK